MTCSLRKYTKTVATHYVGRSGKTYPVSEYINHGYGGVKRGFKDLPLDDYPYTYQYETEYKWNCCRKRLCKD